MAEEQGWGTRRLAGATLLTGMPEVPRAGAWVALPYWFRNSMFQVRTHFQYALLLPLEFCTVLETLTLEPLNNESQTIAHT